MNSLKPKIIAIVGPTASGKTALSIALAKKFNGEIISADSRQIYREMDIGTAKPPIETRDKGQGTSKNGSLSHVPCLTSQGVPHYLIDIKNPDEDYTVAEYKRDAETAITDILQRKKLPILIGGTGLYVKTLLENLDIPRVKTNSELRQRIENDIKKNGLDAAFKELVGRDPEAAYIVDPKNPRRIVRALEVAILTGEPFTAQRKILEPKFDALILGINPPPDVLRERINLRIDIMMQDGLVTEVENLIKKYGADCQAFDAIGYREIIDYLKGKISLQKSAEDMKMNTWHYAKRQMTWFKRDKEIHWIKNKEEAEKMVDNFLNKKRYQPTKPTLSA